MRTLSSLQDGNSSPFRLSGPGNPYPADTGARQEKTGCPFNSTAVGRGQGLPLGRRPVTLLPRHHQAKAREAALGESEERYRALVQAISQAVWRLDAAGQPLELFVRSPHVEVAYSVLEDVEAAWRFQPEVGPCDLGLPGMDGYQVATGVCEEERRAWILQRL